MCGIYGGHPSLLENNADKLLAHRGPDQHGKKTFEDRRGVPFVMGMTRLNIVDRRDMTVPFSARGAYIVFNGEIYNWREIRKKLEKTGIRFETETDIEVVLHAFLEWGPACLDRFNGMFAFAVWHQGELFIARDRLGKKPVFYSTESDQIAFASELKAFSRLEFVEVDLCEKLEFYFDEHTPYRNVKSLKPGEHLTYDTSTGNVRLSTWGQYPEYQGTITDLRKRSEEHTSELQSP